MLIFKNMKKVFFIITLLLVYSLSAKSQATQEDKDNILKAHNEARKEVNVAPLKWSEDLEKLAQEWADYLAKTGKFEHRPNSGGRYASKAGENIAEVYETTMMAGYQMWIDEKPFYNPVNGQCRGNKVCGHYTQIVWKKTTEVGCASAKTKAGSIMVVCNYMTGGNMYGEKAY